LGELNEKIKRKAHVKQSFSLDFLERGTFTEYPYKEDTGITINAMMESAVKDPYVDLNPPSKF
ncbi:MAG: hypothetical protein KHW97_24960, partial [Bacteroides sp.]|nr:hypothetical protein [Bacteroides sp.]MBS5771151.1 hypothetical protein [Bacteroides sp.]